MLAANLFTLATVSVVAATTAGLRLTEAEEALITVAAQECIPYDFPVADQLASLYPAIWVTADLSGAGIPAYDKQLFATLNASIPNIAPRGTRTGDFTGVNYDSSDPDCWWTYELCTTPKVAGLQPDITKCDEPNTWGFTLDDGPNCSHNAYYDYLKTIDQKATLFYIGSNVMDWPLEAQRGLSDGHEICAHTWSHPYMTSMTNEQAFAELYYSKKAIKDILGITVRCWRPPFGDVDDRVRFIAHALDMVTIVWEEDTYDYDWVTTGIPLVQKNYEAILNKQLNGTYAKAGPIVLSHELDNGTMALSREFLPQIQKAFTGGVMPVAVCTNNTNPYLEQNNTYPNYAQYVAGTHVVNLVAPTAAAKDVRLVFASGASSGTAPVSATSAALATGSAASKSKAVSASSSTAAASSSGAAVQSTSGAERLGWSSFSIVGGMVLAAVSAASL